MYKEIISKHTYDYLVKKGVKGKKSKNTFIFTCPFCNHQPQSASIFKSHAFGHCWKCNKAINLLDLVKVFDKIEDEEEALNHVKNLLNIQVMTKQDETELDIHLDFYNKNEFDLVPIANNNKIPVEKDWTNKSHKEVAEWKNWIASGLNIGVKTGKVSNITIIDIDQKPIPEEIEKLMGKTLVQESSKGYHLFYKYVEDFPKTRIDELKIDIENDGGQVVIYPSIIDGVQRKIESLEEITEMPKELHKYLLDKITVPRKTESERVIEDIKTEEFNIGAIKEGSRNDSLVRLGGIFRKELNLNQTSFVLRVLNKHMCENPLSSKELNAMINSLDRYSEFDEKELSHRVMEYLKDIEEANRNEISMAVAGTNRGEDKKRIDKVLSYLTKEGIVLKKGRSYLLKKKVEWKEALIDIGTPIDFEMPYFNDLMYFHLGDLLLIGATVATGKTHIAINIIKNLVKQGIKPYYLSLEGGSRWAKIALQLGLKEGDFWHHETSDPYDVEFEKNSVTIIDWLCPNSYAETDKILKYLNDKVRDKQGVAIAFVQLRDNNEWLAKDLIKQFPAFASRYVYTDESGEYGKFKIDKIRDAKIKIKKYEIPCQYSWETKELTKIEESPEDNKEEKNELE